MIEFDYDKIYSVDDALSLAKTGENTETEFFVISHKITSKKNRS